MEIKQNTVFAFTFLPDGVAFSFQIMAENRTAACEDLLRKIQTIQKELQDALNKTKSGAAS